MRFSSLGLMKCPYCGSNLEVKGVVEERGDELVSGIIKCDCNEFPVVESILTLKTNSINKQIIELIENKKMAEATIRSLWSEYFERINYLPPINSKLGWILGTILSRLSRTQIEHKYKTLYKTYTDKKVSFCGLLGNDMFGTYLKHRLSTESLWSLFPFLPLFKKKGSRILDLCCGTGHGSYILSNYVEPHQLFCAEYSFRNLYLTRKYFVKNAECICLDANYPLPFNDDVFSSILLSDAFFLIASRFSLAREMERTLLPEGFLLLLHLHNSLLTNPGGGYPLTPKGWSRLFSFGQLKSKTMPEREIIKDFLLQNKLDLTKEYDENNLNSSNAVILLATSDESLFATYDRVDSDFLRVKNNLVINPIYEIKENGTKILLERTAFGCSLGELYPFAEKYLPISYEFDKESVNRRRVRISNSAEVEALMKKFILINLPENYL